jgi:hypothetical protein
MVNLDFDLLDFSSNILSVAGEDLEYKIVKDEVKYFVRTLYEVNFGSSNWTRDFRSDADKLVDYFENRDGCIDITDSVILDLNDAKEKISHHKSHLAALSMNSIEFLLMVNNSKLSEAVRIEIMVAIKMAQGKYSALQSTGLLGGNPNQHRVNELVKDTEHSEDWLVKRNLFKDLMSDLYVLRGDTGPTDFMRAQNMVKRCAGFPVSVSYDDCSLRELIGLIRCVEDILLDYSDEGGCDGKIVET